MFWRLLSYLGYILSAVFLLLALANFIPQSPFKLVVVSSGSMRPALKPADLVIIYKTKDYRPKDIILFSKSGKLILHRLVNCTAGRCITKGDANPSADKSLVARQQIIGKVILAIPWLGIIINWRVFFPVIFIFWSVWLLFSLVLILKNET